MEDKTRIPFDEAGFHPDDRIVINGQSVGICRRDHALPKPLFIGLESRCFLRRFRSNFIIAAFLNDQCL